MSTNLINAVIVGQGKIPGLGDNIRLVGVPAGQATKFPRTGFIHNLNAYNPNRDVQRALNSFGLQPLPKAEVPDLLTGLSESLQGKILTYGIAHIVIQHKAESSNFTGLTIGNMTANDLHNYNGFLQSLNGREQQEYSDFLGINFKKIGQAIGNAAKAVGKGVGSAAKAVGHAAAFVAKPVVKLGGKIGTGVAHVVRDAAVGTAHVVRDAGVGVAHVARDVGVAAGKFTAKNWPYLAAAAAIWIPGLGPEVAAGLLGAISAMKNSGYSDQQIDQTLQDQGYPSVFGGGGGGDYDTSGNYAGDDGTNLVTDSDGNISWADGSTYNTETGAYTSPDGQTTYAEMPDLTKPNPNKKTNWWLWGGIAVAVAALVYWLHKHKKLNFKF
ncbi:hypothetical protein HQ865_01195 [Mucilaginibacter mali]|uniref:Uncharacterized protein n=1 Tax=Mucilaginibacter mali TaxID=2740462 RepID=A0A7D4QHK1_9SPHI|nr:hypothetical protein [Mucilaginibacter mali]QKJ28430.1 hypothetical protein HQ865_01195 [Mucilaginibacter mali]